MAILVSALFGLLVIAGGFWILTYTGRTLKQLDSRIWWPTRVIVILAGLVLGASQIKVLYHGVEFLAAYPYPLFAPRGNAVGFPFMVVFFDNNGADYFSPLLSIVGAFGNAIFWAMVPHYCFAYFVWRYKKVAHPRTPR